MNRVTVPCRCCGGSGHTELTGVYAETLSLLRKHRSPVNGAALAAGAGCHPSTMCNRLVVLERLGLAEGRRNGRERLWVAKKGPE